MYGQTDVPQRRVNTWLLFVVLSEQVRILLTPRQQQNQPESRVKQNGTLAQRIRSLFFFKRLKCACLLHTKQAAHLEQSTPYYVLSELIRSLIALIVQPDRRGNINMEDFSEAMPAEV